MWEQKIDEFRSQYLPAQPVQQNPQLAQGESAEDVMLYANVFQHVCAAFDHFGGLSMLLDIAQSVPSNEHTAYALAAMGGIIKSSPNLKITPDLQRLMDDPMFPTALKRTNDEFPNKRNEYMRNKGKRRNSFGM